MGHQPKVSIILPSLNVASYIRECLESVTRQTLKDIEIICVDSGSTDGTLEVIREFEAKDPRVKVIVSDKKSYGRQMNLGFDAATGRIPRYRRDRRLGCSQHVRKAVQDC